MRQRAFSILVLLFAAGLGFGQTGQSILEAAIAFEKENRYDEALKSYERLLQSDADPEVLLRAKLGAGRIYLSQKANAAKARPLFEEVAKQVRFPDLAATALVYAGKTMMLTATTDADFDGALSEFDTVIRAYPNSSAVVEALMSGGSILEMRRKYERAIINYQSVVFQFPQSHEVPIAFVRLGRCLAKLGTVVEALEAYHNVQLRYSGTSLASEAKSEATLLYRLFLQKSTNPAIFKPVVVAQKSEAFKLKDPSRLHLTKSGDIQIQDKERILQVSRSGQTQPPPGPGAGDFISSRGETYRLAKNSILLPSAKILLPYYMKQVKRENFDEITSIGVNHFGEIVVSTKGPDGLFRVDRESGETSSFSAQGGRARRILIDSENNHYVLDSEGMSLLILDSRAKVLGSLNRQALGMKSIEDFGLDAFDNIYVLDRQGQFVIVGGISRADQLRLQQIHRQAVTDPQSKPIDGLAALAIAPAGTVYTVSKDYLLSFQ